MVPAAPALRRRIALALGSLLALVAAAAVVLLLFPWNVLREPLAHYLTTKTGRTVVIAGDLDVRLAWHPWIEVRGVAVANAPWSDEPVMARAGRIGLRVVPLSYFTRLRIPEIEVDGLRGIVERNREGVGNWVMGDSVVTDDTTDVADLPRIGRVRVIDGDVRYRDADPRLKLDVSLRVFSDRLDGAEALLFAGDGTLRGGKFRVAGAGEGLGELRDVDAPFSLRFGARAGDTEVLFDGSVVPSEVENVRGFVRVKGKDMAQLYPLVPAPVPWTPPYAVEGRLKRLPDRWQVDDLAGKVGASDIAGTLHVRTDTPRRKLVADLVSRRLDYRDLGGFLGLPPGRATLARSADQKATARKLAGADRVFNDERIELDRLRDYDATLRFRGESVRVDAVPMQRVEMDIELDRGVLRYQPVKIGIADGTMTLAGTLDANETPPRLSARIEGRNLDLARLYPELASPRGKAGRIGGFVQVRTAGSSVARMAAAANGQGGVVMAGGEASALALLLTNLDLAGAIPLIVGGDETAAMHCAISAFAVADGVVTPRVLIVDTSKVRIDGEGSIDLGEERYDLVLTSKSKQMSLFALRGPIVIGGSLRHPTVGPSVAPIAARVGVAVGLAAITPPLAILPFIDWGTTPDVDCRRVLDAADNASVPDKAEADTAQEARAPAVARSKR